MDMSVLTNRVICDVNNNWRQAEPCEEILYQRPPTPECPARTIEVITEEDAMTAVKMDPAVLEVQVNKPEELAVDLPEPEDRIVIKRRDPAASRRSTFERMMLLHQASLLSLSPEQFDLLLQFAATLRQQRVSAQKFLECAFCKNNGWSREWYCVHALRDGRGRVRCPVLRALRCPRCGATGDAAHTLRYCPHAQPPHTP